MNTALSGRVAPTAGVRREPQQQGTKQESLQMHDSGRRGRGSQQDQLVDWDSMLVAVHER
jgi:hypothetical protein